MAENRRMLRNGVKNGNVLADCAVQLELLPFICMDVAEEMPLGISLQNEVEDFRGTHFLVEDAERRMVRDKDVKILWNVFVGNSVIAGNGAYDHAVTFFNRILQDGDSGSFELTDDVIGLVQIEG